METREELIELIKSPETLTSPEGREPGVYRDTLLPVLGNKVGKIFKNLNTKVFDVKNDLETLSNDVQEKFSTYNDFVTKTEADIEAIHKEIDSFKEELGTLDEFTEALNS